MICTTELSYLFGWVGRFSEDGLPVRPYKHDEKEVEEDQVDNWWGIKYALGEHRTFTIQDQCTSMVQCTQ